MNKNYSILILPQNETKVKRLGISHVTIRIFLSLAVIMAGMSAWLVGDYLWMKIQSKKERNIKAQLTVEVQTLKTRHHEEVTLLRNHVQSQQEKLVTLQEHQQEKLLTLQEQIKSSQKLLLNWKGLRTKVQASLPRQRRASLNGQHVVENLEETLLSLQDEIESLIASIPSQWPTKGWLSSGFGKRKSPWNGKMGFHSGIDIANNKGTGVHAPGDGIVKYVGNGGANGKNIVLNHGQGITTHYGHLSKIHVKRGQRINKNQKIANIGNTGRSTNPHLHYEIRVNGIPLDPRRRLLDRKPPLS